MDALFDQLRQGDAGLKRRDIGSFNKIKDCFRAFEVVMWLMTRLGIEEEVQLDRSDASACSWLVDQS